MLEIKMRKGNFKVNSSKQEQVGVMYKKIQEQVGVMYKKIDALLEADDQNILEKISDFLSIYRGNADKLSHPELRHFWFELIQKHGELLYQLNLCQYPQTYQSNIAPFFQLVGMYKCALLTDLIQRKIGSEGDFAYDLAEENIHSLQDLAFNYQNVGALKILFQYYLEGIDRDILDKQEMEHLESFMANNIPQMYFTPGAIMIAQLYQAKTWSFYQKDKTCGGARSFAEKCIFHWFLAYHLADDRTSNEYIKNAYNTTNINAEEFENVFKFMGEDIQFGLESFAGFIEYFNEDCIEKKWVTRELVGELESKAYSQAIEIVSKNREPVFDRDINMDDRSPLGMKLKQAFNFIFNKDLPEELKINQKMSKNETKGAHPIDSGKRQIYSSDMKYTQFYSGRKRRRCSSDMKHTQFFPRIAEVEDSSEEKDLIHSPQNPYPF